LLTCSVGQNRSLKDELGRDGIDVDESKIGVVVADATDEDSMLQLTSSSRVVVSCTGPYWRYGEAAVKACIKGGSHYVDITGEVPWIERMIAQYENEAKDKGVALLPFAGYDCIPPELGMFLVGNALDSEANGAELGEVQLNIGSSGGGGMPHGTLQTFLDGFEGKLPQRKKGDPFFYPKEYRAVQKDALSLSGFLLPRYQMGTFTGPNFMSAINVPVLCRSSPILGFSSNISISDRMVLTKPSLMNGYGLLPVQVYITTLLFGGIAFALRPVRGWMRNRYLKGYSYGGNPSSKVHLQARGVAADGSSSVVAKFMYPGDPGIYATGLFAAAVSSSLLEATANGSERQPLAGFNSPVAALARCRDGLLVENLKSLGAEMKVEVLVGNEDPRKVDAMKLRSKL